MEGIRWWVGLAARALRARPTIIGSVKVNATARRGMCRSLHRSDVFRMGLRWRPSGSGGASRAVIPDGRAPPPWP